MKSNLNESYPAVPSSVPLARRELAEFAAAAGASALQLDEIRLASSEALTNVVVHAYRDESGTISVTAAVVAGELWMLISDDGCGLCVRADRPGLGLGLALIARASDDFMIVPRATGGTEVRMRFDLPAATTGAFAGARSATGASARLHPGRVRRGVLIRRRHAIVIDVSACIALATCATFPQLPDDEPLLLDALRARGVEAQPVVWDDPAVDWSSYALVVVRSTWDYTTRREEFVAWAESIPRLLNPAEVIRWNTDKRYLAGIPHAVRSEFVGPGDKFEAPPAGEYVVKPSVSAGARDTARYGPGEFSRAKAHVDGLLEAGRTVIVQPYLGAVDQRGETALVFFGGEYSHAIRKGRLLARGQGPASGLYVEEDITRREPTDSERSVAEEILDSLPWRRTELLYARVDLIPDADGSPRLVELELTEPSLFLSHGDGAPARLAERVLERL